MKTLRLIFLAAVATLIVSTCDDESMNSDKAIVQSRMNGSGAVSDDNNDNYVIYWQPPMLHTNKGIAVGNVIYEVCVIPDDSKLVIPVQTFAATSQPIKIKKSKVKEALEEYGNSEAEEVNIKFAVRYKDGEMIWTAEYVTFNMSENHVTHVNLEIKASQGGLINVTDIGGSTGWIKSVNKEYRCGEEQTLTLNAEANEEEGYHFSRWEVNEGGDIKYEDDNPFIYEKPFEDDVTIVAVFEKINEVELYELPDRNEKKPNQWFIDGGATTTMQSRALKIDIDGNVEEPQILCITLDKYFPNLGENLKEGNIFKLEFYVMWVGDDEYDAACIKIIPSITPYLELCENELFIDENGYKDWYYGDDDGNGNKELFILEDDENYRNQGRFTSKNRDWKHITWGGKIKEKVDSLGVQILLNEGNTGQIEGSGSFYFRDIKVTIGEESFPYYESRGIGDCEVTVDYDKNKGLVLGAGQYNYYDEAELTAIPKPGYKFDRWEYDGEAQPKGNVLNLTIDGNKTVGVNFIKEE